MLPHNYANIYSKCSVFPTCMGCYQPIYYKDLARRLVKFL